MPTLERRIEHKTGEAQLQEQLNELDDIITELSPAVSGLGMTDPLRRQFQILEKLQADCIAAAEPTHPNHKKLTWHLPDLIRKAKMLVQAFEKAAETADSTSSVVPAEPPVATPEPLLSTPAEPIAVPPVPTPKPTPPETPSKPVESEAIKTRRLEIQNTIKRFTVLLRQKENLQAELDKTPWYGWLKRGSINTDLAELTKREQKYLGAYSYLKNIPNSRVDLNTPAGREIERLALERQLKEQATSFERSDTLGKIVATQRADVVQIAPVFAKPQPPEVLTTAGRSAEAAKVEEKLKVYATTKSAPEILQQRAELLGKAVALKKVELVPDLYQMNLTALREHIRRKPRWFGLGKWERDKAEIEANLTKYRDLNKKMAA